jgi:NitT/TauT family transport system substrate-binding protein
MMFTRPVTFFWVIFLSVPASAQLKGLNVGYSGIGGGQLPAWVAKETGIFRKNDLDVQLVYFRGGTTAVMALLARETPIASAAGPGIISAALRGADAVMIAGGVVTSETWFVSRPEIKTGDQLKGGSVAIASFGGAAEFHTRTALKKFGLIPQKDVAIVQVGSSSERLAALETGKVQSAMLSPPDSYVAQKKGFHVLMDFEIPYQSVGVATTRRFIRENPDIVSRYVRSHIIAIHLMKTDRETGLKILTKYLGSRDKEIMDRTYDHVITDEVLPPKQYPTLEGIKAILEPLADKDPKAKAAKPEDFVEMSFVKELDQSGYVDRLYKRK